jgi:hypothetical protein
MRLDDSMRRLTALLASLLIGFAGTAQADTALQVGNPFAVPDDYPGLIGSEGGRALVNVSQIQAKCAILYYYKLHGAWPSDWRTVAESGLFSATLLSPFGQVISPDDGRIDFDHDLQFSKGNGWSAPRLILYRQGPKRNYLYTDMPTDVKTFSQVLSDSAARQRQGVPASLFAQRAGDMNWLNAYAAGCVLNSLLIEAWTMRGSEIESWGDFKQSGFFPHSSESLNPLTGRPWAADGTPGSLMWFDSEGANRPPHLKLVDPDTGQPVSLRL